MLAYLCGFALGNKFYEKDIDIDYRKIDIKNVEVLLISAKMTQQPERYIFTEKDANSMKAPGGKKRNSEVIDLINEKVIACCLTTAEAKILFRELKCY